MATHTFNLPESACPSCGKILDAATATAAGERPSPGDFTICLDCGHLMAFATDLTVRALTDAEIIEIAGDRKLLRLQKILGEFNTERRQPTPTKKDVEVQALYEFLRQRFATPYDWMTCTPEQEAEVLQEFARLQKARQQ